MRAAPPRSLLRPPCNTTAPATIIPCRVRSAIEVPRTQTTHKRVKTFALSRSDAPEAGMRIRPHINSTARPYRQHDCRSNQPASLAASFTGVERRTCARSKPNPDPDIRGRRAAWLVYEQRFRERRAQPNSSAAAEPPLHRDYATGSLALFIASQHHPFDDQPRPRSKVMMAILQGPGDTQNVPLVGRTPSMAHNQRTALAI